MISGEDIEAFMDMQKSYRKDEYSDWVEEKIVTEGETRLI